MQKKQEQMAEKSPLTVTANYSKENKFLTCSRDFTTNLKSTKKCNQNGKR